MERPNIVVIVPIDFATLAPALSGFVLAFGLIAAIGAQNAFILRTGVRGGHLLAAVLVCALSDVVLITGGIAGVGILLEAAPWSVTLITWAGVAFLTVYGLLAARRAIWPSGDGLTADDASSNEYRTHRSVRGSLAATVLAALGFTWLNPHAYLDTVVVLGSIANALGDSERWVFAAGAILASFTWFTVLGFGAKLLAKRLASPTAWRILDGIIAVVMLGLAATLAFA